MGILINFEFAEGTFNAEKVRVKFRLADTFCLIRLVLRLVQEPVPGLLHLARPELRQLHRTKLAAESS